MDSVTFDHIASGVQSIVISIATFLGALWAFFKFNSLQEVEKAKKELEQLRRGLEEKATLNFTIQASQLKDPTISQKYILVKVGIQNLGNRTEIFEWGWFGMYSALMSMDENGVLEAGKWEKTDHLTVVESEIDVGIMLSTSVSPGEAQELSYLIPASKIGIYNLYFSADMSPVEQERLTKDHLAVGHVGNGSGATWGASTYFCVE
jgi:hypothetical protein